MLRIAGLRLTLLCAFSLCSCAAGGGSKFIGHPGPPTRFYMMDGATVALEDFKGRNLVLLYWATTCTYSHRVIDALNDFAKRYGRQKNVEVVAVSVDKFENAEALRDRIKFGNLDSIAHSFSGNEYYDESYIAFDIGSLPTVIVIDSRGQVVAAGKNQDVVYKYFGMG